MTHGLLELGEVMLASSQRRLEVVSKNVANTSTPGFKKQASFHDVMSALQTATSNEVLAQTFTDFSQGALRATGRPLDLAISGAGFFKLRSGDSVYFSRGGTFERNADGLVIDQHGFALQTSDGRDLVLTEAGTEVLGDGTVLENGLPIGRIGLFQPFENGHFEAVGGSLFRSPNENVAIAESAVIRPGMIEASNVEMAGEMVEMMEALRVAETGSRVVQTYDTLVGQSISTFGKAT